MTDTKAKPGILVTLFSLNTLITKNLLSVIWGIFAAIAVLGLLGSLLSAIVTAIQFESWELSTTSIGAAIVILLVMLIVRIILEYLVVFFKIHDAVVDIQVTKSAVNYTGSNGNPKQTASVAPPLPGQGA